MMSQKFLARMFLTMPQWKKDSPKKIYKELKQTIADGGELDSHVAEVVANVMKDWAIEKGATHFTHWFQPCLLYTSAGNGSQRPF